MSLGVLFPGQGSQHVGMGADLFDARPDLLGERADAILGWSLRETCLDGPEDLLTRTEHAQPALFALSFALWSELTDEITAEPGGAAGHSLGEYTALTAAGAFDYEAALRVVARRGAAMAGAADREPSGMAALIGAEEEDAERVCAARRELGGRLQVANINAPGQVVVAGGREDITWLEEHAREHGIRRVIPLKVAGAFHSAFMEPAARQLGDALSEVSFARPRFPVWSNTTAQPHTESEMAATLVSQVVSPVRFSELLGRMGAAGVDVFLHVGPGDVTAGMARRTVPGAEVLVASDLADVGTISEALGTMGAP